MVSRFERWTGLSPNKTRISVYILGIEDKKYLAETYGAAIAFGFENTNNTTVPLAS